MLDAGFFEGEPFLAVRTAQKALMDRTSLVHSSTGTAMMRPANGTAAATAAKAYATAMGCRQMAVVSWALGLAACATNSIKSRTTVTGPDLGVEEIRSGWAMRTNAKSR